MDNNDTPQDNGHLSCAEVLRWLWGAARAGALVLPPPQVSAHIVGWASCRGALALLASSDGVPSPEDVGCTACEEDLPAYIDLELSAGVAAAQHAYPAVWWHLWVCPSCLESYELIKALIAAEQEHDIPPLPFLPKVPRPLRTVRLGRAFLNRALPLPRPELGPTRGAGDVAAVLMDEDEATAGYQFAVRVQQEKDATWTITGTALPPIVGRLVAELGDRTFAATFDTHGTALIRDVPTALLAAADGPDLICHLELDGEA